MGAERNKRDASKLRKRGDMGEATAGGIKKERNKKKQRKDLSEEREESSLY